MKVLFLDFDGVLNHYGWDMRNHERYVSLEDKLWNCDIAPQNIKWLKEIVQKIPELNIVISSTWRKLFEISVFKDRLSILLDISPDRVLGRTGFSESGVRGGEIKKWLDEHSDYTEFVILDDDSDMEPVMDHFLLIDGDFGLREEDVKRVIDFFEKGKNNG